MNASSAPNNALTRRSNFLAFFVMTMLISSSTYAEHAGDATANEDNLIMLTVTENMTDIAQALLKTMETPNRIEDVVGYKRLESLSKEHDHAARTNWVYWPYLREGLQLQYMTAEQRILTHDLLHAALSSGGYLKAIQIMQMEKVLAETETVGFPRGTEKYTLVFFGEPSNDTHWGWRFEGHHLSLNFAVAPGEVSVTPSFMGASPAQLQSGALAGYRTLREVHDLGRQFIIALNQQQQSIAIQDGNPPFDIVSGTLNKPPETIDDWKNLPQTGIEISQLNSVQKQIAQNIVDEVISTYRPEISKAYLNNIDINQLRFSWFGGIEKGDPHYYRLDGPDFFFEYDLVQNNGNHVHTVWRSKQGDFGQDLLMQHHQQSH